MTADVHARPAGTVEKRESHGEHADVVTTGLRACAGELVGTFVLVLAITTTTSAAKLDVPLAGAGFGSLAVALVNGLALTVVVAALGHVSGGHVNPAVTAGLAVIGRFPWRWVPGYVVAQMAGGGLAALATWVVGGAAARGGAHLAANSVTPGVSDVRALVTEVLATFVLVLVVTAVTTDRRGPSGLAPLLVGAALAVAVFVAGPVDGAAINPARALGPMLVAGSVDGWWIFVLGPLAGGVLAAVTYRWVLGAGAPPEVAGAARGRP